MRRNHRSRYQLRGRIRRSRTFAELINVEPSRRYRLHQTGFISYRRALAGGWRWVPTGVSEALQFAEPINGTVLSHPPNKCCSPRRPTTRVGRPALATISPRRRSAAHDSGLPHRTISPSSGRDGIGNCGGMAIEDLYGVRVSLRQALGRQVAPCPPPPWAPLALPANPPSRTDGLLVAKSKVVGG